MIASLKVRIILIGKLKRKLFLSQQILNYRIVLKSGYTCSNKISLDEDVSLKPISEWDDKQKKRHAELT